MNERVYTTFQISKICAVDITTIMAWVDEGKLKAYRTPGGHRRVLHHDLIGFLKKYNMPIPRDVDDSSKKVLIVDDDPITVRLISRVLSKLETKLQIETALDGFEAGQKYESFLPDLVILDVLLPGVDGFRICRNIRTDKKNTNVKVIAISGVDAESTKSKILKCGADAFIPKPLETNQLTDLVQDLLQIEKVPA